MHRGLYHRFSLYMYIKFSVIAFEQPCVRGHSFPGFDCFKSSWIQPSFGNQCSPPVVSLFCNHAYEVTVSPSSVASQLTWVNQIAGLNPLRWLNVENCESEHYINDVIFSVPLYCKFLMVIIPGWRLSVRWHETLSTK